MAQPPLAQPETHVSAVVPDQEANESIRAVWTCSLQRWRRQGIQIFRLNNVSGGTGAKCASARLKASETVERSMNDLMQNPTWPSYSHLNRFTVRANLDYLNFAGY